MATKQQKVDKLAREYLKAHKAFSVANGKLAKLKEKVETLAGNESARMFGSSFQITLDFTNREYALNKEELIERLGLKFVKAKKLLKKSTIRNITVEKRKK